MQGVYVKKVVSSHLLEVLLNDYKGFVYLSDPESGHLIRFMTKKQKELYVAQKLQMMWILGDGPGDLSKIKTLEEAYQNFSLGSSIACLVRPKSKKELKLFVEEEPGNVILEATSVFDNEFSGSLLEVPLGNYNVVGPEPSERRTWFASVFWADKKNRWTVK